MVVVAPPIGSVHLLDNSFGQESLECAEQDDIVLSVEVNPTPVAMLAVVVLEADRGRAVVYLVE